VREEEIRVKTNRIWWEMMDVWVRRKVIYRFGELISVASQISIQSVFINLHCHVTDIVFLLVLLYSITDGELR